MNEVRFHPCPIWVRLLCILYDLFFVVALLFIVGFAFVLSLHALSLSKVIPAWLHSIYYLCWILIYYGYFWNKGQTPAMHIWKLYFIDEDSELTTLQAKKLSNKQVVIRMALGVISPIAWLSCFFNQGKKSMIDFLCKTQIVQKKE